MQVAVAVDGADHPGEGVEVVLMAGSMAAHGAPVTGTTRQVQAATACTHGRTYVLRQAAGFSRVCLECGQRRDA